MTELEKHLSEALQSLSAQYEQEQKSAAARTQPERPVTVRQDPRSDMMGR